VVTGRFPGWLATATPAILLVQVTLATGLGVLLGTLNVFFRDVGQTMGLVLQFWFWLTPIVYPINFAFDVLSKRHVLGVKLSTVYMLNPMANVVIGFQRAIYKHLIVPDSAGNPVKTLYQASVGTYVARLCGVVAFSAVLLWFAQRVFARAQGNFAQEL
jgi:ABC-type polysaccharide/polyol phosphate export permease